jgi:hypothetical protein
MNTHLRAHVGRRRAAIDRLRTLTTGAVVAGVAGTVGFGILAAATFRGNSSVDAAEPQVAAPEEPTVDATPAAPRVGTAPEFAPAPTPRAARTHQGHAATGGSG